MLSNQIRYRVSGNLFNLWLEAKSKIQTDVLDERLYANCVANNVLKDKMQETMDRVSQVCENYDLTVRKTNNGAGYRQHMESPKKPTITVTRQRLQVINKSHLSLRLSVYSSAIDYEVTARIAKASVTFSVFCSVYIHF